VRLEEERAQPPGRLRRRPDAVCQFSGTSLVHHGERAIGLRSQPGQLHGHASTSNTTASGEPHDLQLAIAAVTVITTGDWKGGWLASDTRLCGGSPFGGQVRLGIGDNGGTLRLVKYCLTIGLMDSSLCEMWLLFAQHEFDRVSDLHARLDGGYMPADRGSKCRRHGRLTSLESVFEARETRVELP
jgi:hypothetical protein